MTDMNDAETEAHALLAAAARLESVEQELAAAHALCATQREELAEARVRVLNAEQASVELAGALNEISLYLPCAEDHFGQPEVRCGECDTIKSGRYWCAGCVARHAVARARALSPPPAETKEQHEK